MNASLKQSAGFFCLLILLACSSWYFASGLSVVKLDEHTLSTTADMFVHQLTVRKFDEQGLLANQLVTPYALHYPHNDRYFFEKPLITISQTGQPSWSIRSEKARSKQGSEAITFTKKVVVHQAADSNTQESTLTTEKIIYYPKEKKATSDVLVTFEQPGNKVQSTGMTAYLAEKRVQLLHKARGTYAPKVG